MHILHTLCAKKGDNTRKQETTARPNFYNDVSRKISTTNTIVLTFVHDSLTKPITYTYVKMSSPVIAD